MVDVKLAQHAFPVSVFIRPGKEAVGQLYDFVKNRDIETNRLIEIGPLNLDCDFLARMQTRAIYLAQRCGRNWRAVDLGKTILQTSTEFRFDRA